MDIFMTLSFMRCIPDDEVYKSRSELWQPRSRDFLSDKTDQSVSCPSQLHPCCQDHQWRWIWSWMPEEPPFPAIDLHWWRAQDTLQAVYTPPMPQLIFQQFQEMCSKPCFCTSTQDTFSWLKRMSTKCSGIHRCCRCQVQCSSVHSFWQPSSIQARHCHPERNQPRPVVLWSQLPDLGFLCCHYPAIVTITLVRI